MLFISTKWHSVSIVALVSLVIAAAPTRIASGESAIADSAVGEDQVTKAVRHKHRRKTFVRGVNLAWAPSPSSPNIDGYRVYYGTASGQYTQHLDVGILTTAQLPKPANNTYFYVVVAFKGSIESAPSNEVESTKSVPVAVGGNSEPPIIVTAPSPSPGRETRDAPTAPAPSPLAVPDSTQTAAAAANDPATPTLRFQRRLERLHMPVKGAAGAAGPETAPQ